MQKPVGSAYGKEIFHAPIAQGAVPGTTTLVAGDAGGLRIQVVSYVFTMGLLGTFKFKSDTTDLTGPMDIGGTGGVVAPAGKYPYLTTAPGEPLKITTTLGAANGHLSYVLEK